MEKCTVYDPETLGLYVDKALEPHVAEAVVKHLERCSHCRLVVESYERVAVNFKQVVEQRAPWSCEGLSVKTVFAPVKTRRPSYWTGISDFLKGRKNVLQLASIVAILATGLFYYQTHTAVQDGPSAIVNFIEGDMASVMIFETHPSNHTIIWYTES